MSRRPDKKTFVIQGDWLDSTGIGVHRFAWNLLGALDGMLTGDEPFRVEIVVPKNIKNVPGWKNISVRTFGNEGRPLRFISTVRKRLWRNAVFPLLNLAADRLPVDLTLTFPGGRLRICALHDCIVEMCPEEFPGKGFLYRRTYMRRASRVCSDASCRIVTVSETSKKDLMRLYRTPADRISVIGNGWEHMKETEPDGSVLERLGLSGREYMFCLGNGAYHKNLAWVYETAKLNPDRLFVVSGTFRPGESVSGNVLFTGRLTDGEIRTLMRNCRLFVQPSLMEGFCIPPLEAMAEGAECLVSDASCLPEIYRGAVHYLDPLVPADDLDALLEGELSPAEEILSAYTWKKSAETFYALLADICRE